MRHHTAQDKTPKGSPSTRPRPDRIRMDPILEEELLHNVEMASTRGHVQTASASARKSAPPGGGDSGFANHLLVKWAYGLKSAECVKTEAALAFKAGARGGYFKKLAELGSNQGGNVARELMDLVREIVGSFLSCDSCLVG